MRRRLAVTLLASLLLSMSAGAVFADAATPQPRWAIESLSTPTDFAVADNAATCTNALNAIECDAYYLTATNVGAAPMKAKNVTLEDTLPPGLGVRAVGLYWAGIEAVPPHVENDNLNAAGTRCTVALPVVKCTLKSSFFSELKRPIQPDDSLIVEIAVSVDEPATPGPLTNSVKVEGGEAPTVSASFGNTLEEGPPPFGLRNFFSAALGADGAPAVQAGSHPYELPTHIGLATQIREGGTGFSVAQAVQEPRDILVDLPPGFAGSAVSTPARCTFAELASHGNNTESNFATGCPAESQIGFIHSFPISMAGIKGPLYNMVPEQGLAAEFGYVDLLHGEHVLAVSLVPSPQGYVLRTSSREIPQTLLTAIVANVYGDPAARDGSAVEPHVPTLTAPADCNGEPLRIQIHTDSWQHPGSYLADGEPDLSEPNWVTRTSESPPVTGCAALAGHFSPTLEAHPTTTQGDKPTGLEVTLKVPQEENVNTLATPPLKKAVVALPPGMTVNPASANGLEGCSLSQIGISPSGQPDAAQPQCPDGSKIGNLELKTPALPGTLNGQIYVAKQTENPFGSLLAIYLVVNDPTTGVLVKIPGEVRADPQTGQLTTVIDNSPQFPFSELTTRFFGGQKAALRTPAVCGKYEVSSSLTPWSAPESGPPATPAGIFEITQECAPSAAQAPNAPSFEAGTVTPTAGIFSPFVLKLHREDGSQELGGLSLTLPKGLIGKLAGISECSEPQLAVAASRGHEGGGREEIASPSCPASSEVGSVTVGAGAGLTPYYTTGHAYLTGPYKGAPLGLAIITPAVAGPYDLGTVVVRTALHVDPYTAQITAVSDEIPHILQGIPLDVRSIALRMDRSGFTLNPTSCEASVVGGVVSSTLGQSAPVSNRFQVGGCKALGFNPKLALSLNGATRRSGHPTLKAVLTYPKQGAYANVGYAQVSLPHTLFLDQGNLDKVCTQPQLASNTCPASSVYGRAKAWTPLLEKPLEGNVYLGVGFGHELPDLVAELNGQIRVLLHGKVDTDKADGLRNTFEVVPDALVSKFVLELKGGKKYGLLENHEDVCLKTQRAGAKFIGQNGKVDSFRPVIHTDCKRHKKSKGKRKGRGWR